MNLMIVPGMLVCSSFLISVCMFIVSKALLISSATVIVHAGEAISVRLFCFVQAKTLCKYGYMYFFAALVFVFVFVLCV